MKYEDVTKCKKMAVPAYKKLAKFPPAGELTRVLIPGGWN